MIYSVINSNGMSTNLGLSYVLKKEVTYQVTETHQKVSG